MPELSLQVAVAPSLDEPMWCYMNVIRRASNIEHRAGLRRLTRVSLHCPSLPQSSVTRRMAEEGVIELHERPPYLLDLEFDHGSHQKVVDFRPELPLRFRYD